MASRGDVFGPSRFVWPLVEKTPWDQSCRGKAEKSGYSKSHVHGGGGKGDVVMWSEAPIPKPLPSPQLPSPCGSRSSTVTQGRMGHVGRGVRREIKSAGTGDRGAAQAVGAGAARNCLATPDIHRLHRLCPGSADCPRSGPSVTMQGREQRPGVRG